MQEFLLNVLAVIVGTYIAVFVPVIIEVILDPNLEFKSPFQKKKPKE